MATMQNPYAVLGLAPSADLDAVKRRYRTLARELHPDVNGSDEAAAAMVEVNEAYTILSDPEKRRRVNRGGGVFLDYLTQPGFKYHGIYRSEIGLYKSRWCHQCGVELHDYDNRDRRADALYCSSACRQKAYRARVAATKRLNAKN
jgi:curved DNA-binding protein CbpA